MEQHKKGNKYANIPIKCSKLSIIITALCKGWLRMFWGGGESKGMIMNNSCTDLHLMLFIWGRVHFLCIELEKSIPVSERKSSSLERGGSTIGFIVSHSLRSDRLDSVCEGIKLSDCQLRPASIPKQGKAQRHSFYHVAKQLVPNVGWLLWELMAPHWSDQILSHTLDFVSCG